MKKPLSFCLILWLGSTFLAGCAAQTKSVRPDWQNPDHRRVGEIFVPLLRAAGREPASCQAFFFETEALNAVSMGNCTFGFSIGLARTEDVKLIRGVGAHEIGHELLGHADKRKAAVATEQVIRTAVSFIPGIGGLVASSAVLVAGMVALPAYSRSQEAEADDKAVEILQAAGDSDPAGTMVHTFRMLLARHGVKGGGLLDTHPNTQERLEAMQRHQDREPTREAGSAIAPSAATPVSTFPPPSPQPGQSRPNYNVGQKWTRSDGEYTLIRIEGDRYIFSAGPNQEVHLTRDLMVAKMQKGGWRTEFSPPPSLPWPLEVGKWGAGRVSWQVPNDLRTLSIEYTWSIEAYEDVHVPAGTFKAFRIVLSWEPAVKDVVTMSNFPPRRLVSWFAPEVQLLVKAESHDPAQLAFQVTGVDRHTRPTPAEVVGSGKPSSTGLPAVPSAKRDFQEERWHGLEEKLRRLKELREKDLITEEQYQETTKELLKKGME